MKKLEFATLNGDFKVPDVMIAAVSDFILANPENVPEGEDLEDVVLADLSTLEVGMIAINYPDQVEVTLGAALTIINNRYISIAFDEDGSKTEFGIDMFALLAQGIKDPALLPKQFANVKRFRKFTFHYDPQTEMYSLVNFEMNGFQTDRENLPPTELTPQTIVIDSYYKVPVDHIDYCALGETDNYEPIVFDPFWEFKSKPTPRVYNTLAEITVVKKFHPSHANVKVYTEMLVVSGDYFKLTLPSRNEQLVPVQIGLSVNRVIDGFPVYDSVSAGHDGLLDADYIYNFVFYFDDVRKRYSLLGVENREKTEEEKSALLTDQSNLPGGE